MTESKSVALPLGYTPLKLVSPGGFEPPTHGLEDRFSIQLSYEPTPLAGIAGFIKKMERMMRIELTQSAWKADVLPLNYIRILERKTRFELATLALARRCSTPEPLPHIQSALVRQRFKIIALKSRRVNKDLPFIYNYFCAQKFKRGSKPRLTRGPLFDIIHLLTKLFKTFREPQYEPLRSV